MLKIDNSKVLRLLLQSHLILEGGTHWSLGEEALWFIYKNIHPESITLETGIGYSTFVFAQSKHHIVCFPNATVEERIRHYAEETKYDIKNIQFLVGKSQFILPSIKSNLDMALIDGDHTFPIPLIDWYYIGLLLKIKGMIIIDDLHIPSVRILYDFLNSSYHWEQLNLLDNGRTVAFVKKSDFSNDWWGSQELNNKVLPIVKKLNARIL